MTSHTNRMARRVVARYLQATIQHPPRKPLQYFGQMAKKLRTWLKESQNFERELQQLSGDDRDDLNYFIRNATNGEADLDPVETILRSFQDSSSSDVGGLVASLLRYLEGLPTIGDESHQMKMVEYSLRNIEYLQEQLSSRKWAWEALPVIRRNWGELADTFSTQEFPQRFVKAFQAWLQNVERGKDILQQAEPKIREMVRHKTWDDTAGEFARPASADVEILYHASVNAKRIYSTGFTVGKEFNAEGLGGGTEGISFTSDLYVAKEIMRSLKEVILIAHGKVRLRHLLDWVQRAHLEDKVLNYYRSEWGKPKDIPLDVFRLYTLYLAFGTKRYNPVFFGNHENMLRVWKSKSVKDTGILVAKVDMRDPRIKHLPAEREYRVPADAVISIEKLIN